MLNFANVPVRLLHLSIGKEFHGEDEVTAADLKIEVEMDNDSLDALSGTLRPSLFDADGTEDFVSPNHRPHVRNPQLGTIRWNLDSQAVAFGFLLGGRKKDAMLFPNAKLTRLDLLPKEGARVTYTLRVRVFPNETEGAQLMGVLRLNEVKGTLAALDPPDGDEGAGGDDE
ncbi:hypothetical protein [Paraburkholderia dipogonis]|uniref:hypothetical protein n=1 Tax=Paraburkholderia dipogonis TaxID=1211383 RepID=UPI0038BCC316